MGLPAAIIALMALALPAASQCQFPDAQRLASPTPEPAGAFGFSVDMDGSLAVVGAPSESPGGLDLAGAAHIYRLDNGLWTLEATLAAPDARAFDSFGNAVAIGSAVVAVGAPGADAPTRAHAGAVYLFRRHEAGEWRFEAKITLPPEELIGQEPSLIPSPTHGLALDGQRLLIGSRLFTPGGVPGGVPIQGRAWIYETDGAGGWERAATLEAAAGMAFDEFGCAVDLRGEVAIVGAWRHDAGASDAGAAYIFRRDTAGAWVEEAKLTSPQGPAPEQRFGGSVAVDGASAAVGAPRWPDGSVSATGRGWAFERRGGVWESVATLAPPDLIGGERFGLSIAHRGDVIAVGADRAGPMENQGAVYTFARSPGGFDLRGKMVAREAWIGDRVGQSVAMSGTTAIVGARLRARPGEPGGAACIFDASSCITCRADLTGDGILDFFDFLAFQELFGAGDLRADFTGDGVLDFFDFLAFQNEFAVGCR